MLDCGRRLGKTTEAERELAETGLAGLPAAYVCPTYKMLSQVWRDMVGLLPQARRVVSENRLELPGGGSIDMWSGDDAANALRGRKYAKVIIDEAALIPGLREAWEKSIRPTLTDLRGEAWFLSTPRRGGTFEELFLRGQGNDPEWQSWKMPTAITVDGTADTKVIGTNNPWLVIGPDGEPDEAAAIVELEAARNGGMSRDAFAQEYLADFEASESDIVHPKFDALMHVREAPVPWSSCLHRIVGIDPGGGDPTAIVPLGIWKQDKPGALNVGMNWHQYGEFYRRGDVTTEDIIEYLGRLNAAAPITRVIVGETGGNLTTNSLIRAGFPAERYLGTRDEGLKLVNWALETRRLSISPSCTNSVSEFAGYRWAKRRDGETGERYATATPVDNHADAMDARRYALSWSNSAYLNAQALPQSGKQTWGAETNRRKPEQVWAR